MGEEANFVRQQGIGKSNRSLLHYHNEETTKVKLKACSVVLTDIFRVGRSVCARKTNVSHDSATANDLCVYSGSNTTISPQKVSAVIPKNIDKEETTESTVNLRGARDCTHSDEVNDDRPKVNEAEQGDLWQFILFTFQYSKYPGFSTIHILCASIWCP